MPNVTDKEYLERPILEDLKFEMDANRVYIHTPSTSFFNYSKPKKIIQEDILKTYKDILTLCKELEIKISYKNKYKKIVLEIWPTYLQELKEYDLIFDELVLKLNKLKERGIHLGCSDDVYLKECHEFGWKLNSYYYRSSAISQIHQISSEFEKIKNELEFQKKDSSGKWGKTVKLYL